MSIYLSQCEHGLNIYQRVFVATGSGVTIEYIMKKGSACVEAFRDLSHRMANFFGDRDAHRRSKEVAFQEDMRVLVEDMTKRKSHTRGQKHFAPASTVKKAKKASQAGLHSAVFDVIDAGAEIWQKNFYEYVKSTTYDPQSGYPITVEDDTSHDPRLNSGTAFDQCSANVLETDNYADLHGDETGSGGGLGGGDDYATGMEAF